MRMPIICLDERLRHYLSQYRGCFSQPQFKYFVIILLGLMLNQGSGTMTGLKGQITASISLSGLSRFMSQAPWSAEDVSRGWQSQFQQEMIGQVQAEHIRLKKKRRRQGRGRPKKTVVTGYLIGDDSTMSKKRGKKMEGLGRHHSSTEGKRVTGHSLVAGLYLLLGRRCPLPPRMYRQQAVCEAEGIPFASKIDMMVEVIATFEPVPDTVTHVLLDTWYTCKRIWRTARQRGFLITSGLKCNRSLRLEDPESPKGWYWQRVDEYAQTLSEADWHYLRWPSNQERWVYVHVIQTRIKKLYKAQLVIIRGQIEDEDKQDKVRFWASSDLTANHDMLLHHIATRWDIEVLFADTKEILGLDQYQLMTATAICRFWTLVMAAYYFLDQERDRQQRQTNQHTTIGDAWRHIQAIHWCHFIDWLHQKFRLGYQPADLYLELTGESL